MKKIILISVMLVLLGTPVYAFWGSVFKTVVRKATEFKVARKIVTDKAATEAYKIAERKIKHISKENPQTPEDIKKCRTSATNQKELIELYNSIYKIHNLKYDLSCDDFIIDIDLVEAKVNRISETQHFHKKQGSRYAPLTDLMIMP